MKIYARQIPPEYQESPLFMDPESFPDNIAVFGNRDYNSHFPPVFERVYNALRDGSALDAWQDVNNGDYWYSWRQALNMIIPPEGRGEYTREERKHKIPDLLWRYYNARRECDENAIMCELLEIVTGEPWSVGTIRGTCQSEWQEIFYPVNAWSAEALHYFEIEYFNTGSEWNVHIGNAEPEAPEDIDGFSIYCYGGSYDEIKKEIAKAYGEPGADVILYEFSGYSRIANYTEV